MSFNPESIARFHLAQTCWLVGWSHVIILQAPVTREAWHAIYNKSVALTSSCPRFSDNAPLVLACLLIIDSLHFVFARLLVPYLPPAASAFHVLGVATVEVTLFVWIRDKIAFY